MPPNGPETPASPDGREWIWVLAAPRTETLDALLAVEMEDREGGTRRTLPVFETRDQALALRKRLCPKRPKRYEPQAMLLSEAGRFAAEHRLEILLLDAAGTILARPGQPGL
jgi:hypothetical protein